MSEYGQPMQAKAFILPDQIFFVNCYLAHNVPWLFSLAYLNRFHSVSLYFGIATKIAWMIPNAQQA